MKRELKYFTGSIFFLLALMLFNANIAVANPLYFPGVVCSNGWQTMIGVVNPKNENDPVAGVFKAYSKSGELLGSTSVAIPANGRETFMVGSIEELGAPDKIAYCTFDDGDSALVAFSEWTYKGILRAAAPASREPANGKIVIGHILCNQVWRTEISLLNTDSVEHIVNLTFDNGSQKEIVLPGNGHFRGYLRELFNGQIQPDISTLSIADASGLIGLLMTISYADNCSEIAAALPITNQKAVTIYYPQLFCNADPDNPGGWHSNLVITNPGEENTTCQCQIFNAGGQLVVNETLTIDAGSSYDSLTCDQEPNSCLQLNTKGGLKAPEGDCWLKVDTDGDTNIFGSECLISAPSNPEMSAVVKQMGALNAFASGHARGIFAKRETDGGWSGLAFINLSVEAANLTLFAIDNQGMAQGLASILIESHAKVAKTVADIFSGYDISASSYVGYSCDQKILAFQCNGSSDGLKLDVLPGLAAPFVLTDMDADGYPAGLLDCNDNDPKVHIGCDIDDDGDGYSENQGDCDDYDAAINPGADDIYGDDVDQNCDGVDGIDGDRDGYAYGDGDGGGGSDCNDHDATIHPGAADVYGDGIDQNCDGIDGVDVDRDGYAAEPGPDCDDGDATINPGAVDDYGDDVDQNCDGVDGIDGDRDGYAYGDEYFGGGPDCNDKDSTIYPGAVEAYNDGVDQNCDGRNPDQPIDAECVGEWFGVRTKEVGTTTCSWNDTITLSSDHRFTDVLTTRSGTGCDDDSKTGTWALENSTGTSTIHLSFDSGGSRNLEMEKENRITENSHLNFSSFSVTISGIFEKQ